jgi:hypothetical protein
VEAQIRRQATMLGSMIDQLRARGIPVDVASVQVIKEKNNFPEEDETDYWPCRPK